MQHWSKLDHHEGDPRPMGRDRHDAAVLGYGGDHPHLLVTGGLGGVSKIWGDAWMLDLLSGKWKEVS